jgi:hypothetical protein
MRKIDLLIIFVLFALGLSAQPISEQEALQKAQRFLHGKNIISPAMAHSLSRGMNGTPYKHLYLFNVEDNGGFVIVAGDSRAREILGYSDQGHLDYSQMPENMKWWLSQYDEAIASIPADMTVAETRAETSKTDVAPMMSFSWYQTYPYNYYCPQGCLAGCGPLAMAQLMAFHKYPNNLPALEAYTDKNGNNLDALQANYIDYDNMSSTDAAILVRYCGQGIQASYSPQYTSSDATTIPNALVRKFGFDEGACNVYRAAYNSQEWDDLLYKELSEGRPFILAGQVGDDQHNGHIFICHGYSQGYYAVNWGWGGEQNGWYAMDAMITTNGNYSSDQMAVIGIRPNAGGTHDYPSFSMVRMEVTSPLTVNRSSAAEAFSNIKIEWKLRNSLLDPADYQFALVMFTPDNKTEILHLYDPVTFLVHYSYSGDAMMNIGNQYGDGIYRISVMALNVAQQKWEFLQGMYWRYIQAVISGNTITFTNYPDVDAPYQTGIYPEWPVNPDYPDDPEDPDNPDVNWPESNAIIDYPTLKVQYNNEYIMVETSSSTLSDLIESQLGIPRVSFDANYQADCFPDDYDTPVPAEDAPYVSPYAYNFNNEGQYERNWYDMKLFNFGTDIYGGGTPPMTGGEDAEPEWKYMAVAAYCPNKDGTGKHVISYEMSEYQAESLMEGQTAPFTFTRWARYSAKKNKDGIVEAPYRYVWIRLPMEISWQGDDPDAIRSMRNDEVKTNQWYDLQGHRIAQPAKKGLYIRDGRKVIKN